MLAGRWAGDDERERWLQALRDALPEARWIVAPADAVARDEIEVAVVANPAPGALAALPRLKLVQSLWAGVDRLLADATLPPDVPLARMVDPGLTEAMVQTAQWAVLSLHRRFFDYAAQQAQAQWLPLPQRRADEVAVLLLGFGALGRAVAERLMAMGYRVSAWRRGGADRDEVQDAPLTLHDGADALPAALAQADIVIDLLPLTAQTRGLLDARFFAAMRRGAALVNLARGAHVDDAALLAALDAGQLGRAVLDVFATEPLPADHRYWRHPRVTVLPHIAALSDPRSAAQVVAGNVRALWRGKPVAHLVERDRGY
jgi:glyoxylate/hydroxypyruvate reductase A